MNKAINSIPAVTIGLDLGDRFSYYVVLNKAGKCVTEGRVATTQVALHALFSSYAKARVAIEVGTHSPWISRLLQPLVAEVFVANTREVRRISQSVSKSDRVDAETLARLARADPQLLSPIQHRSARTQSDLLIIRARDGLVRARSMLVNQTRGLAKSFGFRFPKCSAETFANKARKDLPVHMRASLGPILRTIADLTRRIREMDTKVETLAQKRYPHTQLLQQVSGVGPLTSLAYVLTIEDPRRFRKSRMVGPYVGLRPRRDQSGERDPQLGITKTGDSHLRRLLVQSSQYILGPFGPDTALRRWGLNLAARGGKKAKKRAVVAVARKLAVLLHRLWVTAEVYEPLRQSDKKKIKAA
jgi:transposase